MFWALPASHRINRLGAFVQPFLVLYLTDGRGLPAGTAAAVASAMGVGWWRLRSSVAGGPTGWAAD